VVGPPARREVIREGGASSGMSRQLSFATRGQLEQSWRQNRLGLDRRSVRSPSTMVLRTGTQPGPWVPSRRMSETLPTTHARNPNVLPDLMPPPQKNKPNIIVFLTKGSLYSKRNHHARHDHGGPSRLSRKAALAERLIFGSSSFHFGMHARSADPTVDKDRVAPFAVSFISTSQKSRTQNSRHSGPVRARPV